MGNRDGGLQGTQVYGMTWHRAVVLLCYVRLLELNPSNEKISGTCNFGDVYYRESSLGGTTLFIYIYTALSMT